MITLLLVSAAVLAACYFTIRRSTHTRVRDIAAMLAVGTSGVAGLAVSGLLFEPPRVGTFVFIFVFGVFIERRDIRRAEAQRQQLIQLAELLRLTKGAS